MYYRDFFQFSIMDTVQMANIINCEFEQTQFFKFSRVGNGNDSKTEVLILSILHFDLKIRYPLFPLNSTFRRIKTGIKNIFPDCRRLLQEYVIKQPIKNCYLTESDQNFT